MSVVAATDGTWDFKAMYFVCCRRCGKTTLLTEITALIDDLDKARADGTIYTYGNVQERLREMLKGDTDD